jgi:hypothetical protein
VRTNKADFLKLKYEIMRRGIIAHSEYLTEENVDVLRGFDFAFLCVDAGVGKKLVVEKLLEYGVPFIDSGIGVYQSNDSLGGLVRTTSAVGERSKRSLEELSFADGKDEYDRNIQLADLNMLAAALAVIRWKRHMGAYFDFEDEFSSVYTLDGNHLLNEH